MSPGKKGYKITARRHTEGLGGSKCEMGVRMTSFTYWLFGKAQAVREMNQSVLIRSIRNLNKSCLKAIPGFPLNAAE